MSNLDSFIASYWSDAQRASAATGIDPSVILAQSALETGYGASMPGNNMFGIKGSGQSQTTKEYVNGAWQTIKAGFATFLSPSASFDGYAAFINGNKRYAGVASQSTPAAQAQAIANAGYASDPAYASKVTAIANQVNAQVNKTIGDSLASFSPTLGAASNAVGNALAAPATVLGAATQSLLGGLDPSQWFQRIALAILAILLIGIALSMLAGKPALAIASKVPVPA